ncbi:CTL plasma membrane transporter, partial [Enterospora canceri]
MLLKSELHFAPRRSFHDAWAFILLLLFSGTFTGIGIARIYSISLDKSKTNVLVNELIKGLGFNLAISMVLNMMMFCLYSVAPKLVIYTSLFLMPLCCLILGLMVGQPGMIVTAGLSLFLSVLVWLYIRGHIDIIAQLFSTTSSMLNSHIFALLFNFLLLIVLNGTIGVCMAFSFGEKEDIGNAIGTALIFSIFWINSFFMYLFDVFTAGIITGELLKKTSSERDDREASVAGRALGNMAYAMGSVAFGALIIAVIKTLRYLVNLRRQRSGRSDEQPGTFEMVILCMADCILSLVESYVHVLNKFTFSYLAITGDSYRKAINDSFELLSKKENVAFKSFVAAEYTQNFLFMIQTILIVGLNIGYVVFRKKSDPVVIAAIFGGVLSILLTFQFCNVMSSGTLALSY